MKTIKITLLAAGLLAFSYSVSKAQHFVTSFGAHVSWGVPEYALHPIYDHYYDFEIAHVSRSFSFGRPYFNFVLHRNDFFVEVRVDPWGRLVRSVRYDYYPLYDHACSAHCGFHTGYYQTYYPVYHHHHHPHFRPRPRVVIHEHYYNPRPSKVIIYNEYHGGSGERRPEPRRVERDRTRSYPQARTSRPESVRPNARVSSERYTSRPQSARVQATQKNEQRSYGSESSSSSGSRNSATPSYSSRSNERSGNARVSTSSRSRTSESGNNSNTRSSRSESRPGSVRSR